MQATYDHSDEVTSSIRTFWFKPEVPLRFTAGQFTELTVPHADPDERGIKRWFTISSTPGQELVSITTRFYGTESSSFKKALFGLEPGTEVSLEEAMGDFVLPKLPSVPVVFVAGGIGITPMLSMLQSIAQESVQRNIRLLWSVRSEDDIAFQEVIADAGVHATIVVSDPTAAWGGERGRLDAEKVLGLEKPSDDTLIYLSGPEPMLEALEKDLADHNVAKRQIVTDFFPGYTSL